MKLRRGGLPRSLALACAALLGAAAAFAGSPLTGSGESISRDVVSGGGEPLSGPGYALNSAVAEAGVSTFSGAGLRLYAGLMHELAVPGAVTSIVAVSKDTGTLDLAWSAPGRDGALGDVSGGFYRIDYSSESSHAFAPTTYSVEFATSVVSGATQTYRLSGLLPNTTYYAKIYLADERKVFAGDSRRSDESTLTNLPVSPVLSGVWFTSVTFSWTLPAGAAEGFAIDGSSTNFGQLYPGGVVTSSSTGNGLTVTLTVPGLLPGTTYYFKLASLNWQSERNFATVIATRTLVADPPMVQNLATLVDGVGRRITLSWTTPFYKNADGILVIASTNPITSTVADLSVYPAGFTFPDGSVVAADHADTSHLAAGLELGTTHYFALYAKNLFLQYSVAVTTFMPLDIPPMAPGALASAVSVDGSSITLSWAPIVANYDGSAFSSAAPKAAEHNRLEFYRSTGIARGNWVFVGSAPVGGSSVTLAIPVPGALYYYRVFSLDSFTNFRNADRSMVVDTRGNLYALSGDDVSRLKVPSTLAPTLQPSGNNMGRPLLVRAAQRTPAGGRVATEVAFKALDTTSGQEAKNMIFPAPLSVTLGYKVVNGLVVPNSDGAGALGLAAAPPAGLAPAVSAAAAADQLGVYYFNGVDWIKVYGQVDPADQTVTGQTIMPGSYQVRTISREASFTFDLSNVSNKAITPNGDGLNDTVIFVCDNPRDSGVAGRIYDARGAFVADMQPSNVANCALSWDGKANGSVVPRGVYIYQIKAEDKTFNGTVVVIR